MKKTRNIIGVLMFIFIALFNFNIAYAKSIDVKTFKEFEKALLDQSVTTINLKENIKFENNINYLANKRSIVINGNSDNYIKIDATNYSIIINDSGSSNSTFSIVNAEIFNFNLNGEPSQSLFIKDTDSNTKYYLKDVRFYGYQFIYAPNTTITLDGFNKISSDQNGLKAKNLTFKQNSDFVGLSNYGGSFFDITDKVILEENSKVYSYNELEFSNLYLKQGSTLTIQSTYNGGLLLKGNATVEKNATIDIQPESVEPSAQSKSKNAEIQPAWIQAHSPLFIVDGSLNINVGANLYVSSNYMTRAIILRNSTINFDNPADINIKNSYDGHIINLDENSKINMKFPNTIYLWYGSDFNNETTTYKYKNINGSIKNDLSTTNNNSFDTIFNTNRISRMSANATNVLSYNVTFDPRGGLPKPSDQIVVSGEKAIEPSAPIMQGYIFDGWLVSGWFPAVDDRDEMRDPWDFNNPVTRDLFLIARWKQAEPEKQITVTFDSNGGTAVQPIHNVKSGSLIKMPFVPKKANNVFAGWFADKEFRVRWIFSKSKVYDNITLYGRWSRDN